MMTVLSRRTALALAVSGLMLAARPALALTLDEARSQGLVAERLDGYVEALDGSAAGLAASVNAQRRQVYEQTAAETGQPLAVVEQLAGERQISRAQPGWYVQTSGGFRPK